ncbi:top-2 [Symbiodinium pilosum]|uniref:DNA topoisomerase 2 n=1 Tax=Symbiodinium pilosum TaxID=2952 RepID=A0A812NNS2_SYMPI|nr:top-2 [Symbiodinium pilosum]
MIALLHDHGLLLEACDLDGRTPLLLASEHGRTEALFQLLPTSRSRRGRGRGRGARGARGEDDGLAGSPKIKRSKTVEQTYQKKTQVEHILLRPDTYVGSVEHQDESLWVWNDKKGEMDYRNISYVPALYKVFDEILVNAADNLQRDPKMKAIKVDIDRAKGRIKVWNDGKGIPIKLHKKYKVFVPELVFGHLLTSDNYDDSERKVTGGRNGYGAKLTNVFSKKFVIETAGGGKKYKQEWTSNMSKKGKPQITKGSSSASYTCVEFWPDLAKFGMKDLEADTVSLMMRRVYDIGGTSGDRCSVYLNGRKLNVKNFVDYCQHFHGEDGYAYAQINKRWQVLVARSDGDGFQQNSFVNAISTPKGGTHVNYVLDQLVDAISSKAAKQAGKGTEIKRVHVKSHLWLFINCLIENPAFSSQTKEQMTLKASQFGSSCSLPRAFIDEVLSNTGIVDAVIAEAQSKMTLQMDKNISKSSHGKRVLGVPKLEDANEAGGKLSKECTLILTEGDSAKALAVAGLAVLGRDKYGVFPLRGKLLNVREINQKALAENKEAMNIVKILGLSFDKKKLQDLRYGKVMIMADQDYDGSHIKGLLINFFHYFWPDLLRGNKGFLQQFVTPIVKATKDGHVIQFFTMVEYEKWKTKTRDGAGWKIKYYKGLGTSTAAEAKEYFGNIHDHRIDFKWKGSGENKLIDMAFNKGRSDDRKSWMNKYKEGTFVDHSKRAVSYEDFVNKELVQFSRYDLMRSVPSVMDGLKPTQRKVLYCCFKRNLRSDVKVAQLVGYVGEHSAYHHGEASLAGTIVSMAQDFVGSNNLNLLVPSGQFGTRAQGGKDAASARYIYTRLSAITRLLFSPLDDPVLEYQVEEGQKIEPYWYAPIIPMILVNGTEGIGTGWSTSVPNYNPLDIIANIRLFIKKKPVRAMQPWYRGFTGTIKPSGEKGKYDCLGAYTKTSTTILQITELPLRKWTQDYKEFLQSNMPGGDQKKAKLNIYDVREYHTERSVHFVVRMDGNKLKDAEKKEGIEVAMRLKTSINETNMVLFDNEGRITKYKSAKDIMQEFAKVRLKMYDRRKKYLIQKLTLEKELLGNRARFIAMIIAKKLHVNNRKKADVVKDLVKFKFRRFGDTTPPRTGFEYLLGMQILTLTLERKLELEKLYKSKGDELVRTKKTSIQQMWNDDLDKLEDAIRGIYQKEDAAREARSSGKKRKAGLDSGDDSKALKRPAASQPLAASLWKGAKGRGGRGRGRSRRGRGGSGRGEEDEEEEDEEEEAPVNEATEQLFGDVGRLTASLLKSPGGLGTRKRRRM